MKIRQCMPCDRADAAAFLDAVLPEEATAVDLMHARLDLSVVAVDDDNIKGIALYMNHPITPVRELIVIAAADQPQLVQLLVDRALGKLHACGIHKCRVLLADGAEPDTLWEQSQWSGNIVQTPPKAGGRARKAKAAKAAAC